MIVRIAWKSVGLILILLSLVLCLALTRRPKFKLIRLQFHMRLICRLLRIFIHFEGDYQRKRPSAIVANHISYLDIPVIGSLFPTAFLAKMEISHWPFIGGIARLAMTEFVDRGSVGSGVRALRRMKAKQDEMVYCLFPEGTTTPYLAPLERSWRRGHVHLAKAPEGLLYGLGIHYRDQAAMAWIGEDAFLPHLFRVMGRQRIDVYLAGKGLSVSCGASSNQLAKASYGLVCEMAHKALSFDRSKRRPVPQPLTSVQTAEQQAAGL